MHWHTHSHIHLHIPLYPWYSGGLGGGRNVMTFFECMYLQDSMWFYSQENPNDSSNTIYSTYSLSKCVILQFDLTRWHIGILANTDKFIFPKRFTERGRSKKKSGRKNFTGWFAFPFVSFMLHLIWVCKCSPKHTADTHTHIHTHVHLHNQF